MNFKVSSTATQTEYLIPPTANKATVYEKIEDATRHKLILMVSYIVEGSVLLFLRFLHLLLAFPNDNSWNRRI